MLPLAAWFGAMLLLLLAAPVILQVWHGQFDATLADPLALPTGESFDLVGYRTVLQQGDFLLYFQNSMVVTVASLVFVLLFGAQGWFGPWLAERGVKVAVFDRDADKGAKVAGEIGRTAATPYVAAATTAAARRFSAAVSSPSTKGSWPEVRICDPVWMAGSSGG